MAQFDKEFLKRTIVGDSEAQIIEDIIVDHRRWAVVHSVVFKHDGRFYQMIYDAPATELQDVEPFEGEPEVMEVTEVCPVTVEVRQWVRAHGPTKLPGSKS